MTLPPLEQQQRIGKLDERRRHLKYLQAKRTYLMDQFYQNIYLRRTFRCQQQKNKDNNKLNYKRNYGVLRMIYVGTWMQASLEIIF